MRNSVPEPGARLPERNGEGGATLQPRGHAEASYCSIRMLSRVNTVLRSEGVLKVRALPVFPIVHWGEAQVTFLPLGEPAPLDTLLYAALIFALQDSRFVVADIAGRGWCIPGGRPEPGETAEQAARRETREETGAVLGSLQPLGHFVLRESTGRPMRVVPAFVAQVTGFAPLPVSSEARGVRLMSLDELPQHYYFWDELLAAVFAYAQERAPSG